MSKDFLTRLSPPQLKMVQEAKANKHMLHHRCQEWLSAYDNEPEQINIDGFLDYFQISRNFYDVAEQEFRKLLAG